MKVRKRDSEKETKFREEVRNKEMERREKERECSG